MFSVEEATCAKTPSVHAQKYIVDVSRIKSAGLPLKKKHVPMKISAPRGSPAQLNRNSLSLFVAPCQASPQSLTSKGLDESVSPLWKLGQIAIGSTQDIARETSRHRSCKLRTTPCKATPDSRRFVCPYYWDEKRNCACNPFLETLRDHTILHDGLFGLILITIRRSSTMDEKHEGLGMTSPRLT